MIASAIADHVGRSKSGVTSFSPSTAESTEIAGVIAASP